MEKSLPLQTLLPIFCSQFITDAAFRERIQTRAEELQSIVFDSRDPSWGLWPLDPEECAGIGFFLGLALENSLDEYLADLPEPRLALLEAQARSGPWSRITLSCHCLGVTHENEAARALDQKNHGIRRHVIRPPSQMDGGKVGHAFSKVVVD